MIKCKECSLWIKDEEWDKSGTCYLNPPTPIQAETDEGLQVVGVRPMTDENEGCHYGQPKDRGLKEDA